MHMDNINSNRVLLPILPIVRWYTYDDYFWNDFIDPLIFIRILILYTISARLLSSSIRSINRSSCKSSIFKERPWVRQVVWSHNISATLCARCFLNWGVTGCLLVLGTFCCSGWLRAGRLCLIWIRLCLLGRLLCCWLGLRLLCWRGLGSKN